MLYLSKMLLVWCPVIIIPTRSFTPARPMSLVTFAYYTGWRKQEILSLKWNQVDLNARTVRLEAGTTKNGAGRPRR
jgi:integrase